MSSRMLETKQIGGDKTKCKRHERRPKVRRRGRGGARRWAVAHDSSQVRPEARVSCEYCLSAGKSGFGLRGRGWRSFH